MNQTENFNTSWLSLKSLPILLYFGSILIMSTVFCAFRFFNRSKRSSKDAEKKKQNAANSDGHTSRFRSACRAVFFSCTRINLNKDNKYFVNKKNTEANDQKLTARAGKETTLNIPNASNDKLSKVNHLSPGEDEFLEKQQSRSHSPAAQVNREEASLTQIVIAQIEHDNNERNRKVIESTTARHFPQDDANWKSSLDKHQGGQSKNVQASAYRPIDAAVKNTEQALIQHKLNVPLGQSKGDTAEEEEEDPIYDVPPSKSLINLNSNADEEISLQKQHHIQVNSDLAYFHTSSPNIFLAVAQEESIYDTPSTRSLAV